MIYTLSSCASSTSSLSSASANVKTGFQLLKKPGALQTRFELPKEARLRFGYQYDLVRKKGTLVRGPLFHLAYLSQPSMTTTTQCGMVVSRRVGGAVMRNKMKRRLRDLYRHDRHRIVPGVWLVVIATSKAAIATMAELRAEWLRLGERLSIFSTS